MSQREWSKLPVRHKGCVKEALGVKYLSMHWRCMLGDAVQSVLITDGISNTKECQNKSSFGVMYFSGQETDRVNLPGSFMVGDGRKSRGL